MNGYRYVVYRSGGFAFDEGALDIHLAAAVAEVKALVLSGFNHIEAHLSFDPNYPKDPGADDWYGYVDIKADGQMVKESP